MKIQLKKFCTLSLAICVTLTTMISFGSASETSETIRVGLCYENTSVSSFKVHAEKGIQLGSFKDGGFSKLYEEPTSNKLTIRKDAYFVQNQNGLQEYKPSNGMPEGEKIGPFHVKIGQAYADYPKALQQIKQLKEKGLVAYPAFTGEWQVWTGFYLDRSSAEADIVGNIQSILGEGTYQVIEPSDKAIVASSSIGEVLLLFAGTSGVLRVVPKAENNPYIFQINEKRYRGELEVRRFTGSDMTVINVLPMQQYLYGVVPGEIQASSHPEALKAQAVAARTYALGSMWKHRQWEFNVCSTTNCQVYKGVDYEAASTNKAIDETKGKKVTYNGKLAQVFYFSSSGGRTEDVKNVWGSDVPYLKSVEDKYESGTSWHYNWEVTLTAAKIKAIMLDRGYNLGDILSLLITKRSEAGRVTELVIQGSTDQRVYTLGGTRNVFSLDSQWYNITTDADMIVRVGDNAQQKTQLVGKKVLTASGMKTIDGSNANLSVIGANQTKRTVPTVPATYKFTGRGWGHGIGMSQEGAKGMANAGFTYQQILMHYFPGTIVE